MAFETSLIPVGVMISYWVDFALSYAEPSQAAWRFPVAMQLVFSLFVISLILWLPESPRWLVVKDRREEAAQVLSALYNASENDEVISESLDAIDAAIEAESLTKWTSAFHEGPTRARTRTLMAVTIQIMNQFCGINVITFYATSIFQNEIGLSPLISRILSGCQGTISFIAALVSVVLIRYFGRRQVALLNLSGMTVSMIALAVTRKIQGYVAGIVASASIFTFIASFSCGFAQVPWIYPAEVTPLATRVQANAMSTATNWVCAFLVVMISPIAFNNIGWRTYLIFACCNFFSIFVVYFCFPETKNRSLEEIGLVFRDSSGLFGAVKKAKVLPRHFDNKGGLSKSLVTDIQHIENAEYEGQGSITVESKR